MSTIVIDAGHGGSDSGAVNGTRLEKNDNLRLARAVRDNLIAQGQKVIMTRDSDVNVSLLQRSAISNSNNADLFVSLHRNSVANPAANGVENWVQTGSPAINTTYAQNVLSRVVAVGVQSNRGVRVGNFSVLRNTNAPSMLFELGFISNTVDNQLFDSNFNAYALAITRGILDSLGQSFTPPGAGDTVIRSIQSTLNSRYNTGLTVDGIYGPRTRQALIKGVQIELNRLFNAKLVVDGIFGPRTKASVPNISVGTSGYLVYLLQAALHVNGYPTALDGIFGPNTQQMVRNFQRDKGLTVDGVAGPNTFERLLA